MRRGEVWWADLGLPQGSAPALRRPVVIISAGAYNRSGLSTVTVVVVTTNAQLAALPGNVAVPADLDVVEVASVVNVTQIATVDRRVLEDRLGVMPDWLMARSMPASRGPSGSRVWARRSLDPRRAPLARQAAFRRGSCSSIGFRREAMNCQRRHSEASVSSAAWRFPEPS
jgi:mRNA interferase MazF